MTENVKSSRAGGPVQAGIERRVWVRYACDLPTSCQPITCDRTASWSARVLNLSCGGLNLVGNRRFEIGTLLHVEMEHAKHPAPTTLLALVVHVRRKDKSFWSMGCAFPKPLAEEEIQALLDSPSREKE
jgi:hypothetical protein